MIIKSNVPYNKLTKIGYKQILDLFTPTDTLNINDLFDILYNKKKDKFYTNKRKQNIVMNILARDLKLLLVPVDNYNNSNSYELWELSLS